MHVQPVLGQPHRNGGEPRIERPAVVVLIEVCVGANQRVLRHVLGRVRLPDHHQHEAKEARLVRAYEARKRLSITAAHLADEVAV